MQQMRMIWILTGALIAGGLTATANPTAIEVGTRTIHTNQTTAAGTPIVPMWKAPMPTPDRRAAAGFPVLAAAEHASVWQPPTREDGAYNHYAALIHHEGRFFAMWGNHPLGEDGPGQRILFAYSDEWGVWSDARELFPAPGPVLARTEKGIHLKADRWFQVDGKLYAVVYVHGAGRYPIAREVAYDGTLGAPFLLRGLPRRARLPEEMQDHHQTPAQDAIAVRLLQRFTDQHAVSWWAWSGEGVPLRGVDEARLIESFTYRARDGGYVLLMRYWGHTGNPVHNNRMYVSFSDTLDRWSAPYPTDIPDSPSRAQALTLDDGTVLLIGNQIAHTFDTALYLDRDPMTIALSDDGLTFDRVYALRSGAPRRYRFPGVGGRNRGFAYASSLIHEGWLYTLYSVGKEDMAITRVPLTALGLSAERRVSDAGAPSPRDTVSLFNGRNLDGWVIENGGQFSVRDGILALDRGAGWLRSVDSFGDFVLDVEVRFLEEKANSGIYVRTATASRDDANGWPLSGYQVQCMDTVEGAHPLGSLIPFGPGSCAHQTDMEALRRAYLPTGEWNHLRITCVGETLTVDLNGTRITTTHDIRIPAGHVGIQGEFGPLEFRRFDVTPFR